VALLSVEMDRRTFLRRLGAAGISGVAGAVLAACGGTSSARPSPPHRPSGLRRAGTAASNDVDRLVTAEWVIEENARPDRTRAWIIPRRISGSVPPQIDGYVNQTSYRAGDDLVLRVNTTAPAFRAFVYRMGFYGGFGARLVAASPELTGRVQAAPSFDDSTNMIECAWIESWTTTVGKHWPTGEYLIKLVGSGDQQQYVPFTVRDDESRAAYVLQSSVTTWQAYNPYGGYSLYGGGPTGTLADRSRVVSFDRPYGHSPTALDAHGSGDFLGNELPLIYLVERHGLDVTYATDVDLHADPSYLLAHRCYVGLGHDEYWSAQMRDGAEAALDGGVNLAFFGANACYRQIRFAPSADGTVNRRIICYKDAEADPIFATDPALATGGSWATDPIPRPESTLIGLMYQSFGGQGPLVVTDGSSWVYRGSGLERGGTIPGVIGSEFDGFEPGYAHPDNVEILAHSPTPSQNGALHSDMAYYAAGKGKGAVFASGTASWVVNLWDGTGRTPQLLGFGVPKKATVAPLTAITLNVLAAVGPGLHTPPPPPPPPLDGELDEVLRAERPHRGEQGRPLTVAPDRSLS
jgi:hypothetical protein